jgi:large subunit ribosomal protein L7Ae
MKPKCFHASTSTLHYYFPPSYLFNKEKKLNFVTQQTAAVLALTEVKPEDKSELFKLVSTIKEGYSDKYEESKRHWGGGIMGQKALARTEKKRKALESAIKV